VDRGAKIVEALVAARHRDQPRGKGLAKTRRARLQKAKDELRALRPR